MPKKKETQFELNWKTAEQLLEERKNIERIPTGTPLDELIGGGIEVGEVVEFYGEYGSGKTQISFTLATYVSGQLKQDVVFIDCEGTFRPERIREIAINRGYDPNEVLKRIYVAQPKTTDEQIAALEKIPKDIKPKLIVIDGVTTLFRSEYIGRETLAEKQGLLRKYLYNLKRYARENNAAIVVTNQVYQSPEASPFLPLELRELSSGGHSLYHAIDNRIFIRKSKNGIRIARLVDSSMYPTQERPFQITEKGVEPPREQS